MKLRRVSTFSLANITALSLALVSLTGGCDTNSKDTGGSSSTSSGDMNIATSDSGSGGTGGTSSTTANVTGSTGATTDATTDGTTTDATTDATTDDATTEDSTTEDSTSDSSTTGSDDPCNYFDQLCPAGSKCTFDGDIEVVHCVELVDDPKQFGDPCTPGPGGSFAGTDDCDDNLVCWELAPLGPYCVPFCGQHDGFLCASGTCYKPCEDCPLGVCYPFCDPLGDPCVDGDVCAPILGPDLEFQCAPDESMGAGAGDPCEAPNSCGPGLVCAAGESVPGCQGDSCCTPVCHLNNECLNGMLVCTPWYAPGEAPENFEHVGVCLLP